MISGEPAEWAGVVGVFSNIYLLKKAGQTTICFPVSFVGCNKFGTLCSHLTERELLKRDPLL